MEVLKGEGQAIWTVARSSTVMKLDYHLALCYPSDTEEAAKQMDNLLWSMVERAAAGSIPRGEEGLGYECVLATPILRHMGRSYQDWLMRTPVRLGGFGLRSMEDVRRVAFIGGLEMALPSFAGEEQQLMPQLAELLDRVDGERRWAGILTSGCRTGQELQSAWGVLKREAEETSHYLGEEGRLEGPLARQVEGAGESNTNGATRRQITTYLEDQRLKVLKLALESHPDQTARPVWAHPQLDKLSQGWVHALPGPQGLNQAEFSETTMRQLCCPSPCVATRVGESLGQRGLMIDPYGDNVLSVSNVPGGSFTARHDLVKTCFHTLCIDAGLRAECEVFGAFRDLLPVEALEQDAELQQGRNRAGLVPDFCLDIPEPGVEAGALGGVKRTLAELKVIGAVPSYYPRSGPAARRSSGVERRGRQVPGEYRRPLQRLDERYHGTRPGDVGPLVSRLLSFGRLNVLVIGAWQEGSQDVHQLLELLADLKVKGLGLGLGRELSSRERAIHLANYRRILSVAAAKAVSGSLLGRVARLGPAHRAAAKRRAWMRRERERLDVEREAHWRANVVGRGSVRGQFVG